MSVREDHNDDDDDDDDDDDNFFNPRQVTNNNIASLTDFGEAVATNPEKVIFSYNLNCLFPKAEINFNELNTETNQIPIPNHESIMNELNRVKIPVEFFY